MRWLIAVIVGVTLLGTAGGIYAAFKATEVAKDAAGIANDVSGADASEEESFYVAANLRAGVERLRRELGPEAPVDFKIEQRALKVTSSGRGGRSVLITARGRTISTPVRGLQVSGPPLSEVDPAAVERIARTVARRARIELSEIAYITTLSGSDDHEWGAYLESGRRWQARLDGSRLRRVR